MAHTYVGISVCSYEKLHLYVSDKSIDLSAGLAIMRKEDTPNVDHMLLCFYDNLNTVLYNLKECCHHHLLLLSYDVPPMHHVVLLHGYHMIRVFRNLHNAL